MLGLDQGQDSSCKQQDAPTTIARLLESPLPKARLALNCLEVWDWRVGLPVLSPFPPARPSPPREAPAAPTTPLPPGGCAMSGRDLVTNPRSQRGEEVNHQQCCAPGRGQKSSGWVLAPNLLLLAEVATAKQTRVKLSAKLVCSLFSKVEE